MDKHSKPGTPKLAPSKTLIFGWLRDLLPDLPDHLKIEDLGNGIVYCRVLQHFCGQPHLSKVNFTPRNQYDYVHNLKQVQTTFNQLGITVPFDVGRVSKRKFLENWALINAFYKHFNSGDQTPNYQQEKSASSYSNQVKDRKKGSNCNYFITQESEVKHPFGLGYGSNQYGSSQYGPNQYAYNMHHLNSLAQNSLQLTSASPRLLQPSLYLKENMNVQNSSPAKGKWSVSSQMLQNNQCAVIDRIKQILLKGSHDTEKIRQIKMLLGMPLDEEEVIKIEDDGEGYRVDYENQQEQNLKTDNPPKMEANPKHSCGKSSTGNLRKPFKI